MTVLLDDMAINSRGFKEDGKIIQRYLVGFFWRVDVFLFYIDDQVINLMGFEKYF